MKVRARIEFVTGLVDEWVFNYDDRDERIDFARRSHHALEVGAVVITRADNAINETGNQVRT